MGSRWFCGGDGANHWWVGSPTCPEHLGMSAATTSKACQKLLRGCRHVSWGPRAPEQGRWGDGRETESLS